MSSQYLRAAAGGGSSLSIHASMSLPPPSSSAPHSCRSLRRDILRMLYGRVRWLWPGAMVLCCGVYAAVSRVEMGFCVWF